MRDDCSRESTSSRRRWLRTAALAAAAGGLLFALVVAGCLVSLSLLHVRSAPSWRERGVTLGMSEREVQSAFTDGPAGAWSRELACGGVALEWTRVVPQAATRWARFEFHDGLLVAIRLQVEEASTARVEQSVTAVRQERPFRGGTEITILTRSCATHAAEAEQIAWAASHLR